MRFPGLIFEGYLFLMMARYVVEKLEYHTHLPRIEQRKAPADQNSRL